MLLINLKKIHYFKNIFVYIFIEYYAIKNVYKYILNLNYVKKNFFIGFGLRKFSNKVFK